jgi:hypothetical protein
MSENSIEATAPAYGGYRAPAVSIRATYTVGEVTDELVVDIDQGPVDVAVIRGVIDAMTEKRDAAIEVEARNVGGSPSEGAKVYGLPTGPQTTTNTTGRPETVITGKEAQA